MASKRFTKGGPPGPGRPKGGGGIDRKARLAALDEECTDEDWRAICRTLVDVAIAGPQPKSSEWSRAVQLLVTYLAGKPDQQEVAVRDNRPITLVISEGGREVAAG